MSLHLRIPIILRPLPRPPCRFVDVEPPRAETGPAPERSPVRARFDSPDGVSTLSVMVRNAQTVKPSLIQVNVMLGSSEGGEGQLLPREEETGQLLPRERGRFGSGWVLPVMTDGIRIAGWPKHGDDVKTGGP